MTLTSWPTSEVASSAGHQDTSPNRRSLDQLDELVGSNDFIRMLRRSAELAVVAGLSPAPAQLAHDLRSFADHGPLHAVLAIESLAVVPHDFPTRPCSTSCRTQLRSCAAIPVGASVDACPRTGR